MGKKSLKMRISNYPLIFTIFPKLMTNRYLKKTRKGRRDKERITNLRTTASIKLSHFDPRILE